MEGSSIHVLSSKRLSPRMGLNKSPFNHYNGANNSNLHDVKKSGSQMPYKLDTNMEIIVKEGGQEEELKVFSALSVGPS